MTKQEIKEIYTSHDSEKLFTVLTNMTVRKKRKRFDTFNTPEQIDNSIEMLVEVFKERGIEFKKIGINKKWEIAEFNEHQTFIKIYPIEPLTKKKITIEAIGQY
ncbi:MAG: hypothetical protein QM499_01210 [Flavobacteriaceae bacterium]